MNIIGLYVHEVEKLHKLLRIGPSSSKQGVRSCSRKEGSSWHSCRWRRGRSAEWTPRRLLYELGGSSQLRGPRRSRSWGKLQLWTSPARRRRSSWQARPSIPFSRYCTYPSTEFRCSRPKQIWWELKQWVLEKCLLWKRSSKCQCRSCCRWSRWKFLATRSWRRESIEH